MLGLRVRWTSQARLKTARASSTFCDSRYWVYWTHTKYVWSTNSHKTEFGWDRSILGISLKLFTLVQNSSYRAQAIKQRSKRMRTLQSSRGPVTSSKASGGWAAGSDSSVADCFSSIGRQTGKDFWNLSNVELNSRLRQHLYGIIT